jgi:hypothetical protein
MTNQPRTEQTTGGSEGGAVGNGDVIGRMFDGRAVRHWPPTQRYHCLAYPCLNHSDWFYIPSNSHLCAACMNKREAEISNQASSSPDASPASGMIP